MTVDGNTSVMAKAVLVKYHKNPANIMSYPFGQQGASQNYRIPTNLQRNNNSICDIHSCEVNGEPQPNVKNTSSLLRRRVNKCTGTNCEKNNFKLHNPLNYSISARIRHISDKSRQCVINPNEKYRDFKQECFTRIINGVPIQVHCKVPIVKVTDTQSTSGFLRSRHLKNNCLPMPSIPNPGSIDPKKIMQNKNCGNSNTGC